MSNSDWCQYRIGNVCFSTYADAEEWVVCGNIGGVYSIVRQVYCVDHLGYVDEVYDREADEFVCEKCFDTRQKERAISCQTEQEAARRHTQEIAALSAWNAGLPIRANEGCGR